MFTFNRNRFVKTNVNDFIFFLGKFLKETVQICPLNDPKILPTAPITLSFETTLFLKTLFFQKKNQNHVQEPLLVKENTKKARYNVERLVI